MKKIAAIIFCACALPCVAAGQDTVHMTDGTKRDVKIIGVQGDSYLVSLPSPIPGQPAATTTMKRAVVSRIVFGPDPSLDAVAANVGPGSLGTARVRWQSLQPFLGTPESRAGEAGCLLGEILLQTENPAHREEALSIFTTVEKGAWKVADRQRATRGRLGVLIKAGKLEEAVQEAEQIERSAEEPELIIETKLLLAQARQEELKKLLAENPRWNEDPPVLAERDRLLNEGLDFALFPFLFHGTKHQQAAQGLWVAGELYTLCDEGDRAAETYRDIVEIYPDTPHAAEAKAALGKSATQQEEKEKPAAGTGEE